jgi:hypothetical protein
MVLVLLGAGLATVASFQDTYETVYRGYAPDRTITTSLWITSSTFPENDGEPAFYAAGWPVLIASVVMAIAVVLMVRQRTAFAGRSLALGSAGVLAGVVYFYVTQVRREKSMVEENWPTNDGISHELNIHGGLYLLVVAAVVGLAGAALAQQREQPQPRQEDEDEDEVVVHQLDDDDDTPPFGIAILSQEDQASQEEQEAR